MSTIISERIFKKTYHGYTLQAFRMKQGGEESTEYWLWEPGCVDDDTTCPRFCGTKKECLEYAAKYPFPEHFGIMYIGIPGKEYAIQRYSDGKFFQGYDFMGSANWEDGIHLENCMSYAEAEQIARDLESAE